MNKADKLHHRTAVIAAGAALVVAAAVAAVALLRPGDEDPATITAAAGRTSPSASTSEEPPASTPKEPATTQPRAAAPRKAVEAGPPPADARFDYQIGGAYAPPAGVAVVSRDRLAAPVEGVYTICYINAFQVQPGELEWWTANHDDLLLKQDGEYVTDEDWREALFDHSTAAKRAALAGIVGGWIDGCAAAGFRAVEPDNLDSYLRAGDLLTRAGAVAFLRLLAGRAKAAGLAIGQKNTIELGTAGRDAGLSFAITEECGAYEECGDYTAVYGDRVFDVEYDREGFDAACAAAGKRISVVLRDLDITPSGSGEYAYDAC